MMHTLYYPTHPPLLTVYPVYTNKGLTPIIKSMIFPLAAPTGFYIIYMVCTKIIKYFICVGTRKELRQYKLSG
jgi:hypothetical protein